MSMEHTLYCGAASGDITPKAEEVSGLFALMGISYAGIIDSLALRVIALKSDGEMSLIVAFDLDKAPQPKLWLPKLSERTGIPEDRILYFSPDDDPPTGKESGEHAAAGEYESV